MLGLIAAAFLGAWQIVTPQPSPPTGGGGGGVAFDARMTAGDCVDTHCARGQSVTTKSSTGLTIGGSGTCLVVPIVFSGGVTGLTCNWDTTGANQAMTQTLTHTDGTRVIYFFELASPTTGNRTLACSWTTARDIYMYAVSFSGTHTSDCVNDANNATQTDQDISATSTATGAAVSLMANNAGDPTASGTGVTQIGAESNYAPGSGAAYHIGATTTHTYTDGGGGSSFTLGSVNVVAP